jgi:polysaccharide deacetylase 2 family uncharacterized protein YibQ
VARKSRKNSVRRGRRPFPWLWIGAIAVLLAAVFVMGKNRGFDPFRAGKGGGDGERASGHASETPSRAAAGGPARGESGADLFGPITVESDWDRIRLRGQSEFLRIFRGDDRAALHRLTSRTLRGALEEVGIGRERIDERPGTAAAAGVGRAPVQWHIAVPPRASLFRINDAVTQAVMVLGGHVIRGTEKPAREAGTALDLRVGYGDRVTHAILVEPDPHLADAATRIALVVTELDRESEELFDKVRSSAIPYTVALRADQKWASRAARELRRAKREVFLHLPMEPKGYPRVDPGKDAILLDLSQVEIEERISRSLDAIGGSTGIISRMGTAAVNDPDVMRAVLGESKRRGLLFVDAHGAGPSVVEETGEVIGARTVTLGGMLDGGGGSPTAVKNRLKQLMATAQQRGTLIIGVKAHGLAFTILEQERERLEGQGIEFVPASKLVL